MAEEQSEAEKRFRDAYGEDPAGAVFNELSSLYATIAELNDRVERLRSTMKEMDPKRMESLERTEILREILQNVSENEK